jgi:hypothetical protein
MSWLDIGKKAIELGAPVLGFALGGPAGASMAEGVARLFGADPTNPADVVAKMQADPDAATKLKEFELQNQANLASTQAGEAIATVSADLKDVDSARQMELKDGSWVPTFLTIAIFMCLAGTLALLFTVKIPSDNKMILLGIVFLMSYLFMVCCRFWLGGSIPTLQDIENIRSK